MTVRIDPDSTVPPYEQLCLQVAEQARGGRLPVGYRLPTVRALAAELGVAVNTVAKAYRTLEADGVVETRGRQGTFVASARTAAAREAAAAAEAFARRAKRLGLDADAAVAAARDAVRAAYAE
ncbi:GntR family transcriptional regulator [Streptomyces sp. 3MP-14]|uniref:GntR family transcriptional regulator n=1 Tax=Streptomyces mimosae TaxID=2586635 RepID=A0A5N5ZUH1_9ACTN|nr:MULTISPECIES: GntR family transcriptional regulator [Streptomyces]KAB8159503.1 GntR family transcriptional regulator [Streptomyces mimosae]KAB8172674.1 GntR family transcriptional regulator [Streptomyces sp. 3MP-14]